MRTSPSVESLNAHVQWLTERPANFGFIAWMRPHELYLATKSDPFLWKAVRARNAVFGSPSISSLIEQVKSLRYADESISFLESIKDS